VSDNTADTAGTDEKNLVHGRAKGWKNRGPLARISGHVSPGDGKRFFTVKSLKNAKEERFSDGLSYFDALACPFAVKIYNFYRQLFRRLVFLCHVRVSPDRLLAFPS
jgi:hypothetical protein